jgi:crossover junction endodeoxyribonuclease RuvC
MTRSHLVAGIDPGLAGALFVLDPESLAGEALDLPVHALSRSRKAKRELDLAALVALIEARRPAHAFVEQAGSMPRQGVASSFAFGKGFGAVLGTLAALRIPVTLVAAATWKRTLGVPAAKDGARARASQLLPDAAHLWPLRCHHGRAEAALLALWGSRQLALQSPAEARTRAISISEA